MFKITSVLCKISKCLHEELIGEMSSVSPIKTMGPVVNAWTLVGSEALYTYTEKKET